jgi:hypothetical protein
MPKPPKSKIFQLGDEFSNCPIVFGKIDYSEIQPIKLHIEKDGEIKI